LIILRRPFGVTASNVSSSAFNPAFFNSATMYNRALSMAVLPAGRGPKSTMAFISAKEREASNGEGFADPDCARSKAPQRTAASDSNPTVNDSFFMMASEYGR
jgi:hypothetical protein